MTKSNLPKTIVRTIGVLLIVSDILACGPTQQADEQPASPEQVRCPSGFARPSSQPQPAVAVDVRVDEGAAPAALDLYGTSERDAVLAARKAAGVGRRASICGRGIDGILCALSNGSALGASNLWQDGYSDANGWNGGPQFYSTVQYPDVDGDGRADVCGRGGRGIWCAPSTGSSFSPISLWQSNFSDANGWSFGPQYYATIQFADVNGD